MPIQGIQFRRESTQEWVDYLERDPADEDGLRLIGAGPSGVLQVLYVDIPGNSWNPQRLAKFAEQANELLTLRIPLADLPADDPDKTTDPNRYPLLYWDGADLCSRTVEISNPTFSNNRLDFTVSRAG